ncbi:hypothetical protein ACI6Q2_22470 [Chitinophagaceae bacterium LWZ2-11]
MDKKKYYGSFKTCNNLYVEIYTITGGGAYGGDLMSHYITDSISFRKFIGLFDSAQEAYEYECKNDSLIVKKYSINGTKSNVIEEKSLFIEDLKKQKKME